MIRFVAIVILSASTSWLVLGYSMLQAQQIEYARQDLCIVPGSHVHRVYRSMLSTLTSEAAEWDEFKIWSQDEMPTLTPMVDAQRTKVLGNLRQLEGASICDQHSGIYRLQSAN